MKLLAKKTTERASAREAIREILLEGKTSGVIGFLDTNRDIELENELLGILRGLLSVNENLKKELQTYLDERILQKMGLVRLFPASATREEKRDAEKTIWLSSLLAFALLSFPLVYLARRWGFILNAAPIEQLKQYVLDFNYYLVYYSATVNLSYLLILLFAFLGTTLQRKYWNVKKEAFLFKPRMLPSISIIAPAYGEESTIIESSNSLLNLKYPDYELIVVNDGSKDATLKTLIDYYGLKRIDLAFARKLETRAIRGIYSTPSLPRLLVVDKENGGKADSLNAGLNVSRKAYFCGIDADSILEPDALLKIASLTVDAEKETVALGGNIMPVNGCRVDRGTISGVGIPRSLIARFQTIEYLRAFMAGRPGWSFIGCLLIISGAFGLFKKDRALAVGGYLTSSGKYKKDTVGEDMELVVRLCRDLREKKIMHNVAHVANANCWTEVPESLEILRRQRDRWHRGLLDIMHFHRHTTFNPRYGKMGAIAMPYFFIFEALGPLIEIQGYVMVVLAGILGMLNGQIALLLFASSILLGILISLCALLITEQEVNVFDLPTIAKLLWYAVLENFGFRQLASFWRVTGFVNSLKKPQGWGTMVRKGFAPAPPLAKAG